jgi:hypothetical protein
MHTIVATSGVEATKHREGNKARAAKDPGLVRSLIFGAARAPGTTLSVFFGHLTATALGSFQCLFTYVRARYFPLRCNE